jgi:hypothetical protein
VSSRAAAVLQKKSLSHKEQMDAQPGGSSFSFADLNADFAGVAFAVQLKKGTIKLDTPARPRRRSMPTGTLRLAIMP